MAKVPFLDVSAAYRELAQEIDEAVQRVLRSGLYIGGSEVSDFEEAFAGYCEAEHCVGVGNGLDALHLALRAIGTGPGDEVIVASNTFIATWLAVTLCGATPVPVEPDPTTFNLDPARIEAAITDRTRVLLPTHLYGQPADLDAILEIAERHSLKMIEDAAQAHGARYKGRRLGSHGDAVAWSFYPGKNLGAVGDAGAVTTSNSEIAERVRMLANYGSLQKYVHQERGVNSRLDPLQASVLGVKLRRLDDWNNRRREVADEYGERLAECDFVLPAVPEWAEPVWHLYVIRSEQRDHLAAQLEQAGIQTLVHYPIPPHLQHAYNDMAFADDSFPIAERLAQKVLSLPIGPHMRRDSVRRVIAACAAAQGSS